MPNHCAGKLTVTGEQEAIEAFREKAAGEYALDLNSFVPMPEEIRNTTSPNQDDEQRVKLIAKYGSGDWYDWADRHWGTKWGVYPSGETMVVESPGRLEYTFLTAWGPFSQNVLMIMSNMFPALEFMYEYAEQGMDFWGIVKAKYGQVTDDTGGEIAAGVPNGTLVDLAAMSG